jgi:hypothetical protein
MGQSYIPKRSAKIRTGLEVRRVRMEQSYITKRSAQIIAVQGRRIGKPG